MKKSIYSAGLVILLVSCGLRCNAQTSATGYFMEGYSYRYMMNPALVSEHGFISIPVLGNIQADANYNFGINQFLFPGDNGNLVTFMHPSISASQVLDNMLDMNDFKQNLNIGILNFGFFVGKSFFNFGINMHQDASFGIPKELFSFLKEGMQSSTGNVYDIRNMNMNAKAYVDIAIGGSTPIFENIRVGGRAKLLLGAASAKININQCKIEMSEQNWTVTSDIEATVYGEGVDLSINKDKAPFYVDFGTPSSYGLAGMGFAVDLGATYTPFENMTVSVAVTDLGTMSWNKNATEKIYAKGTATYSGFDNLTSKNMDEELDKQAEALGDQFGKLIEFKEAEPTGNESSKLNTTFTAGLEYGFLQNRLSAGLLYNNTAVEYGSNINDFTISANVRFIKPVQFSASYTFSNYGSGFGAALGIAQVLFIAIDCYSYKLTPQYAPVGKASPSLSIGLNIPLNKMKDARRDLRQLGYFGSLPEVLGIR